MPKTFLTTHWRNLLMLNYEVDPDALAPIVPSGVELDFWNGKTFLSIVGFQYSRTRIWGLAIPFHTAFDEINLRYYVRRKADDGWRRGVGFIKEVVPRRAVALVARRLYNENFVFHPMRSDLHWDESQSGKLRSLEYAWKTGERWNRLAANVNGDLTPPNPGSEEEFITEHYWGYSSQRDGATMEYRVAHPQWSVWQACDAEFDCDIEGFYGPQYAKFLRRDPTSAFVADGSAVDVYHGDRLAFETAKDRQPAL